jgi:23S rRNA (adenine2503-C2)-methyltransferase
MDFERLKKYLKNEPSYRLNQAEKIICKDLAEDWMDGSSLPLYLRTSLNKEFPLKIDGKIINSNDSNSLKAIISLEDGLKIETVLMKHSSHRNTICLSSQAGCKMRCSFCLTGQGGFIRDLKDYEIVSQFLFFARLLKQRDETISNIVFMGMGEPFLNYENLMRSIRTFNHKTRFNIGARKISVSTCGIPDQIRRFAAEEMQLNLAVSLNASTNILRSKIMPVNALYPLEELISAVKDYILKTKRRVMFEYVLMQDINDSIEDAARVAGLLKGLLCFVNIIPYNGIETFKRPSKKKIEDFKNRLLQEKICATQRFRFGEDINASCGRLIMDNRET